MCLPVFHSDLLPPSSGSTELADREDGGTKILYNLVTVYQFASRNPQKTQIFPVLIISTVVV
jgi:hypothetical protein